MAWPRRCGRYAKKPVSETLILDASLEESSGALTKALRELFNLDWQLDDLGLHQVKAARPRLRQLALYALPEQRSALDILAHRQRATAHACRAAAGGSACGAVYPAVRGGRSPASVRGYPHAALRSSG